MTELVNVELVIEAPAGQQQDARRLAEAAKRLADRSWNLVLDRAANPVLCAVNARPTELLAVPAPDDPAAPALRRA